MNAGLSLARAVADAVLYEGYLLYPYRASSTKNQARWQFGVLGPPGAADSGAGEEPGLSAECLLQPAREARLDVHLRFLQLQTRTAERAVPGGFTAVEELDVGTARWLSWDEAAEQEITFGPYSLEELAAGVVALIEVPAGEDIEPVTDAVGAVVGRLVRRRRQLRGELRLSAAQLLPPRAGGPDDASGPLWRLRLAAENTAQGAAQGATADQRSAIELSFIGAHLLLSVRGADFVSVIDPPDWAAEAAASCRQHRSWPVLAGPEGQRDVLLLSPIILYDHPAVAPQSTVELFDATEIDEILTLRVRTMTDAEKAEARATDPHAAAIIDRCDAMSPEALLRLHGVLRDQHLDAGRDLEDAPFFAAEGLGDGRRNGGGQDHGGGAKAGETQEIAAIHDGVLPGNWCEGGSGRMISNALRALRRVRGGSRVGFR